MSKGNDIVWLIMVIFFSCFTKVFGSIFESEHSLHDFKINSIGNISEIILRENDNRCYLLSTNSFSRSLVTSLSLNDGIVLWSIHLPVSSVSSFVLRNDALFAISDSNFFILNPSSGKIMFQSNRFGDQLPFLDAALVGKHILGLTMNSLSLFKKIGKKLSEVKVFSDENIKFVNFGVKGSKFFIFGVNLASGNLFLAEVVIGSDDSIVLSEVKGVFEQISLEISRVNEIRRSKSSVVDTFFVINEKSRVFSIDVDGSRLTNIGSNLIMSNISLTSVLEKSTKFLELYSLEKVVLDKKSTNVFVSRIICNSQYCAVFSEDYSLSLIKISSEKKEANILWKHYGGISFGTDMLFFQQKCDEKKKDVLGSLVGGKNVEKSVKFCGLVAINCDTPTKVVLIVEIQTKKVVGEIFLKTINEESKSFKIMESPTSIDEMLIIHDDGVVSISMNMLPHFQTRHVAKFAHKKEIVNAFEENGDLFVIFSDNTFESFTLIAKEKSKQIVYVASELQTGVIEGFILGNGEFEKKWLYRLQRDYP